MSYLLRKSIHHEGHEEHEEKAREGRKKLQRKGRRERKGKAEEIKADVLFRVAWLP
jgi:hypothetical protein